MRESRPRRLSPSGEPTLALLCEIMGIERGTRVRKGPLRAAFIRIARDVHPDKGQDLLGRVSRSDMEVATQRLNIAWQLLRPANHG